ncbi:MAG: creatininase family protein [Planctomycetota bacterium]|jgi:hypothetical protein
MRRRITELPARIINRWQVQGGDAVILPVGSVEALGPHLPMGARVFVAEAFAGVLAEAADALLLPSVSLTPVFGTQGNPGTIDVSEKETNTLIRAILDDLVETGFRRIVLVTYLEYAAYYLPQELWEDRKAVVVGADLSERLHPKMRESGIGEDSVVLGALRILERGDLLKRCLEARKRWLEKGQDATALPEAYEQLRGIGHTGVRFPKGHFPLPPSEVLDVDKGEAVLRAAALEGRGALDAMRRYNEFLVRRDARGFLKGGWFKDNANRPEADGE